MSPTDVLSATQMLYSWVFRGSEMGLQIRVIQPGDKNLCQWSLGLHMQKLPEATALINRFHMIVQ